MFSGWLRRFKPVVTSGGNPEKTGRMPISGGLAPDERIYAIGDIHGKLELLEQLQALIVADLQARPADSAKLIYLGDYIDRGGKSRQVVERLLRPAPQLPPAIMLRGNHEQTLLDCIDHPGRLDDWCSFGGLETLMSYGVDPALLRSRSNPAATIAAFVDVCGDHVDFYRGLEISASFGNYFFCHAGVRPGIALHRQAAEDLMWIRQEFIGSDASFGAIIVHGHTPVERPEVRHNRINIDTGAYATRVLTALVLQGDDIRFLHT